jgi:peroxisomal coenzyme A diphosphatase NUDT7
VTGFCERLGAALRSRGCEIENESDYLASAVLVPLVRHNGRLGVLFEVRSAALSWQPGDICFPGGRIELDDSGPMAAALRETREELGLPDEMIEILGPLKLMVSPIGVIIHPFVAYIKNFDIIHPNHGEVAEVFVAPLDYLLATEPMIAHMELATRPLPDFPLNLLEVSYARDWKRRTTYPVSFYQYDGHVIWGLTARVLSGFLDVCQSLVLDAARENDETGGKRI